MPGEILWMKTKNESHIIINFESYQVQLIIVIINFHEWNKIIRMEYTTLN